MRKNYKRRLPPLNAVVAFEACARLGSTVAAGSELGVTHAAVSKQIALLEDWLGLALFDRTGPRLSATPAGAHYAHALATALEGIAGATAELERAAAKNTHVVRVSSTASFVELWLLPRLPEFRAKHPDIEVWVSTTHALVDVGTRGNVDLAIRMGRGPWRGVRAQPLMRDELVPVCAPVLRGRLKRPVDLTRVTLLHDEDPRTGWLEWLEAADLGRPSWGSRGPRLADGALLLKAAIAGQGVALTRRRLARAALDDGRLVEPFGPALSLGDAYWLVQPPRGTPQNASVRRFAEWLRRSARRDER